MGFNYRWSQDIHGKVEIRGFNLNDDMNGRVDIAKLISLVNDLKYEENKYGEIQDPIGAIDTLLDEIVEIPDNNGVYESEFI